MEMGGWGGTWCFIVLVVIDGVINAAANMAKKCQKSGT
jgi:hypothetical protein